MLADGVVERLPTVEEYTRLRDELGYPRRTEQATATGLEGSLYSVCAEQDGACIGCGRITGDGGMYYVVQDMMVRPARQRQGIGTAIMEALMRYLEAHAAPASFVSLIAGPGLAPFYERYGFKVRTPDEPGMSRRF